MIQGLVALAMMSRSSSKNDNCKVRLQPSNLLIVNMQDLFCECSPSKYKIPIIFILINAPSPFLWDKGGQMLPKITEGN